MERGFMLMSNCKFNLKAEVHEVIEQIMAHKWIESEKIGHDIGLKQATQEWIEDHYDEWFRLNCDKFYRS